MKVLIAFECSGIAREAFAGMGHIVTSVDLAPSELPCSKYSQHWQTDIKNALYHASGKTANGDDDGPWNLMIAFVPCDHLAVSGARWFDEKRRDGRQRAAIEMFLDIAEYPVDKICIENPVGIMSGKREYLKEHFPDLYERAKRILPEPQIIQPWQYGHGETKTTCLWLKNLPKLIPTNIVDGREHRVHRMGPSPTRAADRARTYQGIADAMATQWGGDTP